MKTFDEYLEQVQLKGPVPHAVKPKNKKVRKAEKNLYERQKIKAKGWSREELEAKAMKYNKQLYELGRTYEIDYYPASKEKLSKMSDDKLMDEIWLSKSEMKNLREGNY